MTVTRSSYTGFDGWNCLAQGDLHTVVLAVKRSMEAGSSGPHWIFSDTTGRIVDIDFRGTDSEILNRLAPLTTEPAPVDTGPSKPATRGRGRPKLGVIGREVTLLPKHWEWLSSQPGGASVALRKLVDEARRNRRGQDDERSAKERAYHFASAMAGDMVGFEESARALFAGDKERFLEHTSTWPRDVRQHAAYLCFGDPGDQKGEP